MKPLNVYELLEEINPSLKILFKIWSLCPDIELVLKNLRNPFCYISLQKNKNLLLIIEVYL